MKNRRKPIKFLMICILFLLWGINASAAPKLSKEKIILKEGKSKIVRVKDTVSEPFLVYYDVETDGFHYENTEGNGLRITADRAGVYWATVEADGERMTLKIVIMPKKNPAVKIKKTEKATTIRYKKISIQLPAVWEKSGYVLLPHEKGIELCARSSYRRGYSANILSICWCSKKEWKKLSEYLPEVTRLKKKGKRVYYMTGPTDVQYDYTSKKCAKQYLAMYNTRSQVAKSLKIK